MTGALHAAPGKTYSPPIDAKPLTMPAEMVAAIIDGRKTQVRIPFMEQPSGQVCILNHLSRTHIARFSPWVVGDVLWVRETWGWTPPSHEGTPQLLYKATEQTWKDNPFVKWCSPAIMPIEHARLFLRITDVRVQRIKEITATDALAEGIQTPNTSPANALERMQAQWDRHCDIDHEWDVNPWVWVYEFRPITSGEAEARYAETN